MIKKERPVLPEFRAVKYRRGTGKSNVISCCIVMPRTNYFVTVCTCLPLSRGDNCIRINLYCYRDHRTRSRDRWTMMVRLVCWNIGVQISIKAGSKVVASRRAIALGSNTVVTFSLLFSHPLIFIPFRRDEVLFEFVPLYTFPYGTLGPFAPRTTTKNARSDIFLEFCKERILSSGLVM